MIAGLWGCDGVDRPAPVETFMELDSAGVRILQAPAAEALAPLGWELDTIPELVLGTEHAPSGPFMRVVGVRGLPEGGILVLDAGRREVLLFDGSGHEVARRGGLGRGPGEFESPASVPSPDRDSIFVYDINSARITVFSVDLESMRIEQLGTDQHGRVIPVGVVDGLWLRQHRTLNGGSYESAMNTPGPVEEARTLFVIEPHTGEVRELAAFAAVNRFVDNDAPMALVPHPPRPSWTPAGRGLLVTDGTSFEVRELDPRGRLTRVLRVDANPEPLTAEMVQGWARRLQMTPPGSEVDPRYVRRYDNFPVPSHLPGFRSVLVDSEGWLWAEIYGWDPHEPVRWVLFDPDGRARGAVQTPVGFEVHSVGADRVLGVWRSAFGEEFVHSYRLRRIDG
jgi:hypothetical protein